MRDLLRGKREAIEPHVGPVPEPKKPAVGGKSGALRAAIFGLNDGLLTNLSLIIGITGANVANQFVVLAGVAGLFAGAFSMGYGEYISMRVQRDLFERLLHIEAHELATEPEEEREELAAIYRDKGVPADVAAQLVDVLHRDPKLALETHAREELGLDPETGLGSPMGAAASSFVMFSIGALIPLLPFVIGSGTAAELAAVIAGGATLFLVGAAITKLTGASAIKWAFRMLLGGAAIVAVTYGVGRLFHLAPKPV